MTDPMAGLPARSCNDPEHNARRADETYGTPCIACGAPLIRGEGHDEGCPIPYPRTANEQAWDRMVAILRAGGTP